MRKKGNLCVSKAMMPRQSNKNMTTKQDYSHLLADNTPCFGISTTGSASEHELGELACLDGHASLTSCLNDMNAWGMTVAQVAEMLISNGEKARK